MTPRRLYKTRRWMGASALLFGVCALIPWGAPAVDAAPSLSSQAAEWPATWDERPLRPLAMTAVEQRFAARFPGRIARMTDGEQVLVLREVLRPTRMLHPAVDCYRGMGLDISDTRLERDAEGRLWRCFVATRAGIGAGEKQRVCERIVDAQGQAFTDTSSWYWAALSGQSTGPWLAVTRAHHLP
jgi:hypothetical protein